MNNMDYAQGKALKRYIEDSGRSLTVMTFSVALWLLAQERGVTLEEVVHKLIEVSTYNAADKKLDRDEIIRQLMGD